MTDSKITSRYRTTIPKPVRERLGVEPGDVLHWEVVGGVARVTVASRRFLQRRDSMEVGPGSPVDDVRRARRLRPRTLRKPAARRS